MNYPFWDAGVAYGYMMAGIAVLHVFISHFAIGGGLYLVLSESRARKANDAERLAFLEDLSRFFVLLTLVLGALTGVATWFIVGLLSPAATEVLIHHFVWGWAIEWTFFVVEIAAAIIYFYGWKRMPARHHLAIGWIYFAAAWLSLFVINGIITFMLTPGEWLKTGNFWDGFFNPTFWPSLAFRTGVCIMLAGLYALLVASRRPPDSFKAGLVRENAVWGLAGLVLTMPSLYWYWKAIPGEITRTAVETMPTPMAALEYSYWLAGAIGTMLFLFGLVIPRRYGITAAAVVMALGLGWFGAFEWFRESVRKPFIISGYMYGNSLEPALESAYREDGYLARMKYRSGDDGADLFRRACGNCHTLRGYKPLARIFDGTDPAFIAAVVRATHLLRGNMPPFMGTEAEAEMIANHIHARIDRRATGQIYGLSGAALGKKVYDTRCGVCHQPGKEGDKTGLLAGLGEDELAVILEMAAGLGEGMPAFTAGPEDRAAMIEYLKLLGKGETR